MLNEIRSGNKLRSGSSPWPVWAGGLALLCLYLAFPSKEFVTDGVIYANAARTGTALFHPHHLLYAYTANQLLWLLGHLHQVDAFNLMCALGAVLTAASAVALGFIIRSLTGRVNLAVTFMLLYGVCYITLFVGTNAEVYPFNILLNLLTLLVFVRRPRSSLGTALLAGALSALAMLFHQTAVFFTIALAYLLWRARWHWRHQLAHALVAVIGCGGPYLLVAWHLGVRSPAAFTRFLVAYIYTPSYASGAWGGGLALKRLPQALGGIAFSLVPSSIGTRLAAPRLASVGDIFGMVALVVFLVLLGMALRRWRRSPRLASEWLPVAAGLRLWLVLQAGFTLWWNSDNPEFWLMTIPPLAILLAGRISRLPRAPLPRWATVTLIGALATANFLLGVLPDSRIANSTVFRVVQQIGCAGIAPEDVVLGPIYEIEPYAQYRCGTPLRHSSLFTAFFPEPGQRRQTWNHYRDWLADVQRNHRVYLMEGELQPEVTGMRGQWTGAEFRELYQPYLAGAVVVGTYRHLNREWRIYKL